eukprot:UN00141
MPVQYSVEHGGIQQYFCLEPCNVSNVGCFSFSFCISNARQKHPAN